MSDSRPCLDMIDEVDEMTEQMVGTILSGLETAVAQMPEEEFVQVRDALQSFYDVASYIKDRRVQILAATMLLYKVQLNELEYKGETTNVN